ncbi:MAG: hypothetical protein K2Y71_20420 [Xanthobacteraceae bacterium]|nr:hypothetical protein [Xanthobacteraceae bacterium]
MQRVVIGGALIALCTAVAAAQTPPLSKTSPNLPGTQAPIGTGPPGFVPKPVVPGKQTTTPVGPAPLTTPAAPRPTVPNQALAITGGNTINAVFDSKARAFKVNLRDGVHKLDNGGAIRVRGGVIVWDAFGAVERLRRGQGMAAGPAGLG